MNDCLIRVEGSYTSKNNLFELCIPICMHKDLLLPQKSSEFTYFLTWFNEWPSILKTDHQESVIEVTILRNEAPGYFILRVFSFQGL